MNTGAALVVKSHGYEMKARIAISHTLHARDLVSRVAGILSQKNPPFFKFISFNNWLLFDKRSYLSEKRTNFALIL